MEKALKYQQGDVLLYVANIPQNCRLVERTVRGYVLAEGEVTGHAHRIANRIDLAEKSVGGVQMFQSPDGTLYLSVTEAPVELEHEEHSTITVAPGNYEIGIVREIDPFEVEVHNVAD